MKHFSCIFTLLSLVAVDGAKSDLQKLNQVPAIGHMAKTFMPKASQRPKKNVRVVLPCLILVAPLKI